MSKHYNDQAEMYNKGQFRKMKMNKKEIEETSFGQVGHKTMSVGVAEIKDGLDLDDIVNNADKALYFAKENGRNKVVAFSDIEV